MALSVNHGPAVTSGLFTGVTSFTVLAVNPRNAELAAMGYTELGEEPVYYKTDNNNNPYTLVRFFLLSRATAERPEIYATVTFFLYHRLTSMLLNRYGRFGGDDPDSIEKLGGNDAVWYAYAGEIDLMKFLEKVLDVRKGQDFFFDRREDLFASGDDSELREEIDRAIESGNRFKGCVGLRNGVYQTVFPTVVNQFTTDYSPIWREMKRQENHIREYYGPITYERYVAKEFYMREFTGEEEILVAAPTPAPAAASAGPRNLPGTGPASAAAPAPAARPLPSGTASPGATAGQTPPAGDDDNDLPF